MKKSVLIFSVVAGVVLLGGVALAIRVPMQKKQAAAATLVTAPAALVDIDNSVMSTGVLQPAQVIDVSPRTSGQLVSLTVHMGDHVTKGQVIGKIDARNLLNDVSSAENALRRSTVQLASNQVTLTAAQNEATRQHALFDSGVASQTKVDAADDAVRRAQISINNATLAIQNNQIDIDDAKASLEKANVVSPIDGVVAEVLIPEGTTLSIARQQPIILRIAKLDNMIVRAQVSEADITKVQTGQDVYFTILGDVYKRYYGKLRAVDFTPSTGNLLPAKEGTLKDAIYYDTLFDIANTDGRLLPGMTANVHVVINSAKQALTIPVAALGPTTGADHYTVQVVDAAGNVVPRQVVTGISDRLNVQIMSGLKAGEKVVVREGTQAQAG